MLQDQSVPDDMVLGPGLKGGLRIHQVRIIIGMTKLRNDPVQFIGSPEPQLVQFPGPGEPGFCLPVVSFAVSQAPQPIITQCMTAISPFSLIETGKGKC